MRNSLVSIVAPCYNGEEYVVRFLNSIFQQTYENIELIIVDDGSTDRTAEIIAEYKTRFLNRGMKLFYLYQENAGQAAALQKGIKCAKGEYISCLDSDDAISSNFVECMTVYLENNEDRAFCQARIVEISEEENIETVMDVHPKRSGKLDFFEDVLFVQGVVFSGYMFRQSAIDSAIVNREIYTGAGGQNAQLLLPIGWYYGNPGYVEEAVYDYYIRKNSHSHLINTSERIIEQWNRYETIVVNTLLRIPDEKAKEYIEQVQKYYSRVKFGNAIDTRKLAVIAKQYQELKLKKNVRSKDILLYIKYTNPILRHVFHLDSGNEQEGLIK